MSNTATKERPLSAKQPAAAPSNGATQVTVGETKKEIEYVPLGASMPIKLSIGAIRLVLNPRTKSGREPKESDYLKFMMLCRARQLDPFEGDAFLIGYEGQDGDQWSLITSIYAFLKRAEVSPMYDGKESGVIVRTAAGVLEERIGDFLMDDETLLGGWCRVYRKDRKYPETRRVEFKRYSTAKSRWKDDPGGMICKVAECQCLRDTFPTTLGGMFTREEFDAAENHFQTVSPVKPLPITRERIRPIAATEEPAADEHGEIRADEAEQAAADPTLADAGKANQDTLDAIQEQTSIRGQTANGVRAEAKKRFKIGALAEMTETQGQELLNWLTSLPVARQPGDD